MMEEINWEGKFLMPAYFYNFPKRRNLQKMLKNQNESSSQIQQFQSLKLPKILQKNINIVFISLHPRDSI